MSDNIIRFSIPYESLVRGEDINYIFIEENCKYLRIPVKIGMANDKYFSILDPEQNILKANVVKGAYFINAAIEGSEEE